MTHEMQGINSPRYDGIEFSEPVFKNQHGEIHVGERVYFEVENQNMWIAGCTGTLRHDGSVFYIELLSESHKGQRVEIGQYLSAYKESIQKY